MAKKKIILMFGIVLCALLVYATHIDGEQDTYYGDPLTLEEFKLLTDAELINWSVELRLIEADFDDTNYYYYMNVFDYWLEDDGTETVTPVKDTFVLRCNADLYNCTNFYNEQILIRQEAYFNYFKELQE